MRRLLAVIVPLALLAACGGDDDAADGPTTTAVQEDPGDRDAEADAEATEEADGDEPSPEAATPDPTISDATIPDDAPAGDAPGEGSADDEGLGDALLVSDLSAAAEVPGPGADGATGRFEAELHEGVLCVDMVVSGLGADVVGAHLHDGAAGSAGPVVVDIGGPTAVGDDEDRWDDACAEVGDDVIARLAEAPDAVYVNVHTGDHPDGAVRGQVAVASVFDRTLDR
jgi:hypothetical protein